MSLVKLSTPRALPILLVDSTDGFTEEPGLVPTVTVRKAGGAFAAAAGAAPTDRGNGRYEYTPTAGELDTLGTFEWRATSAGARTFNGLAQVVDELPGNLKNGAIDAGKFLSNAINSAVLADNAITAAKLAAGAITASTIATDAIDSDALAASAITEIQSGLATAAAVAALPTAASNADAVWDEARAGHVAAGSFGEGVNLLDGGLTAAKIAADAITAAKVAADVTTEIQSGLATAAAVAGVQSDTDAIQATLAAGVPVTSIALNAITASALAADAVTEIQVGLATAAAVAGVQADTDAIQATLAAGVAVASLGANTVTAAALAADAVAEIQSGLATSAALATVQADTDLIQAALAAGVPVSSIAANAITAAATSADFVTELTAAIDAALTAAHDAGSWGGGGGGGATASQIWQYVIEGSFTAEQLVRLICSAMFGNASGLEGASPAFRDLANTKNRITSSYSAGTRTVATRDGT